MNHDATPEIRRRNRLKNHFTITSNVLLFGYTALTDAEKVTYQAIDSFDWADDRGERKGYAYPSVETLARLRGVSSRSIFRHFDALERVGLLRREQRPGRPTLLWIEEPSAEESEQYLSTITMSPDTDVTPTPDSDVTPDKKDEEEARQNHVNAVESRRPSKEVRAKREWLAQEMLNVLGDAHSLGFYRRTAACEPEHRIFEAMSEVRLADREDRIIKSKGALFASLVRRKHHAVKE